MDAPDKMKSLMSQTARTFDPKINQFVSAMNSGTFLQRGPTNPAFALQTHTHFPKGDTAWRN